MPTCGSSTTWASRPNSVGLTLSLGLLRDGVDLGVMLAVCREFHAIGNDLSEVFGDCSFIRTVPEQAENMWKVTMVFITSLRDC